MEVQCWERQCWKVLTALHGHWVTWSSRRGREELSWMGNTPQWNSIQDSNSETSRDVPLCHRTHPWRTQSKEGFREVNKHWGKKFLSEEPEAATLKGIKKGRDKGIHFLLFEESWWGIPVFLLPWLQNYQSETSAEKSKRHRFVQSHPWDMEATTVRCHWNWSPH